MQNMFEVVKEFRAMAEITEFAIDQVFISLADGVAVQLIDRGEHDAGRYMVLSADISGDWPKYDGDSRRQFETLTEARAEFAGRVANAGGRA